MFKRIVGSIMVCLVSILGADLAQAREVQAAALDAWLKDYGRAWETRDAAAVVKLFTPDATYHEMPFDVPKQGRAGIAEYWQGVTADQRDVKFQYEIVSQIGTTAVAHWSAKLRAESTGAIVELDGVFVLEFAGDGLCSSLREWWHVRVSPAP